MLAIALHLRAQRRARRLRSPRPAQAPGRGTRDCGAPSPGCGGPRRRPLRGAAPSAPGAPEGEADRAESPRPPLPARRRLPAPTEALRFLTSDSRRWLLNASRPLGADCFPLPPPLPLPLADELPAPGAAGSSMQPQPAAPLGRSALSARGDPAAARRSQAPPPPQLLAAVAPRSPAPQRNWSFDHSERDLEEVGGAHSRDFPLPLPF